MDNDHLRMNNNQNTLMRMRDRLFEVLFERACLTYANAFPYRFRKFIEYTFLIFAVIHLFFLVYIHVAFVQVPVKCLETETETWSREGVLRVEIALKKPKANPMDVSKYCNEKSPVGTPAGLDHPETPTVVVVKELSTYTVEIHQDDVISEVNEEVILDDEKSPEFINRTLPFKDSVHDPDCLSPIKTVLSDMEMFTNTVWPQNEYIIEYSLEFGFLKLSPGARQNSSIKVRTVTLDPEVDKCFGNNFSQLLLKYLVGYGDVLMSSLRYLIDKDENKGFVRNVVTGDQYRFVDKSTTWTAYFSAAFIMMVFTLSISMLLRYSHHQILMFIVELLHVFEFNTNVTFPAAPLLTVVLALIGMEAIMSEFFNDSATAFYIILIVWVADQYDTICCHTSVTKRHWLRFFYLYHFAFYAYHYRFNGQYSNLALTTSWMFIEHSMMFFFHRYELPVVLQLNESSMDLEDPINLEGSESLQEFDVMAEEFTSDSINHGDSVSHEHNENQSNTNDAPRSENVNPNLSTISQNIKQNEQSSVGENRSGLMS